jgi:hypothetical protein
LIRKLILLAALLCITAATALAQDEVPVSKLSRTLSRIDFAVQLTDQITKSNSGVITANGPNTGTAATQSASNSLGGLGTLRYIQRPYLGFEFNYDYSRVNETYNGVQSLTTGGTTTVQTNANEYTLGYVVTPPHPVFGFQPYVSGGAGTTYFVPTRFGGGGQDVSKQPRATYYYSVGIQKEYFTDHFGFRLGFRQKFYKAPDFLTNFLTLDKQQTFTSEPTFGFYFKF